MLNTDKYTCRMLANVLSAHGVKHAVVSPGSRCAPLIVAFSRHSDICVTSVIDERSAAFIALGMTLELDRPVALVCTSGSAMLNYAPALAEAYYRHIPLIAITADRPPQWIDQDDGQTIRQVGALDNIVKASCSLPCDPDTETSRHEAIVMANKVIATAMSGCKGPVHINVPIDAPLGNIIDCDDSTEYGLIAELQQSAQCNSDDSVVKFSLQSTCCKIMVVCGFMQPNQKLNTSLSRLAKSHGAVIVTEPQSNVYTDAPTQVHNLDLAAKTEAFKNSRNEATPDIVIVIGGSVVSKNLKHYLRELPEQTTFIHVGQQEWDIDTYLHKALQIKSTPLDFIEKLLCLSVPVVKSYVDVWEKIIGESNDISRSLINDAPWSDFKAVSMLIDRLPSNTHLHLSNGTAVRYAAIADCRRLSRVDCNRGVSGIDGCTSTALGASLASVSPVVLITGDMSAQYDIGALAFNNIPSNFKMAVLCNGEGNIFRCIPSTSHLPELDSLISAQVNLPLKQLADAYGFAYYETDDTESLEEVAPIFIACDTRAILAIKTDKTINQDIYTSLFN